ncbi:hypothetical protein Tco_1248538 [Tanacetum coccineum]
MAGNTVKDMTLNFGKFDKFEGHDFRRWQKKMHFLLTTLKVVYVWNKIIPSKFKLTHGGVLKRSLPTDLVNTRNVKEACFNFLTRLRKILGEMSLKWWHITNVPLQNLSVS